jgi:predicted DNA-binding transcriptional regulator AlpA
MSREKLQDHLAYPLACCARIARPRISIWARTFLRLVSEGKLPKPKRGFGGVVAWDRYRLDACIDDADDDVADNTVDRLLREKQDD